jgi:hypothetical protein
MPRKAHAQGLTILATRRDTPRPASVPWWLVVGLCAHGTSRQNVAAASPAAIRARLDGLTGCHRVQMSPPAGLSSPCRCSLVRLLADEGEGAKDA